METPTTEALSLTLSAKSSTPLGMPKRKQPELKPKEQFKRFLETAKKLEVDESGKEFERVFEKVVPPRKRKQVRRSK